MKKGILINTRAAVYICEKVGKQPKFVMKNDFLLFKVFACKIYILVHARNVKALLPV